MKMKFSLGFISVVILWTAISLIPGDYNILYAKEPFILVTLKDKTSIKFEYQSFSLNWVDTTVIDEYSCEGKPFELEAVKYIYVLSLKEYPCGDVDRDGRLFDVLLYDGQEIMGFIELFESHLAGVIQGSSEEKIVPYSDIKRIRFER